MSKPSDRFAGPLAYGPDRVRGRDAEQHQMIRGEFSTDSELTEPLTREDEWLKQWISERRAVAAGRRRLSSSIVWFIVTGGVVILVGAGSWGLLVTEKSPEALGIIAKGDRPEAASFEIRFRIQDFKPSFASERPEKPPMELRRATVSDISTARGSAMDTASLEQEARPAEPLQAGAAAKEAGIEGRPPLGADEVAVFLKRGQDLIANGDIVAARVILLRVAEARYARGALDLAATFDPIVLKRIGAIGVTTDLSSARYWYGKAEEFGSEEAPRRLQLLTGM